MGNIDLLITLPDGADLDTGYEPVRADISRLLRNRTFARGAQGGAFTATTDPTAATVDSLIDDAASDVASKVGTVPEAARTIARRVVSLGVVLLIELGSRDFDQARYDRWKTLYDTRLAQLIVTASDADDGTIDGEDVLPVGQFDPTCCEYVEGTELPRVWGC